MLRSSTLAILLVGSAYACESSTSTQASSGIAFEELPALYADAACEAYQNCIGPLFSLYLNGSDCSSLTAKRFENGTFSLIAKKIEQGTVQYAATQAQGCLDALRQLSCAQLLERDQPECLEALDGLVALGSDCDLSEECAGSALCQSSDGTCPGRCVALLSAGQACATDSACDDGLQCSKETKLCVKPATDGQDCEYGSPPCGPGLLCLGKDDDKQTPGTCHDAKAALSGAEGESCDPGAGMLCKSGLSCVAQSYDASAQVVVWSCVKTGTYKTGEACKPGAPEACSSGNYCQTSILDRLNGNCTAVPDAKQSCGTGFGAQCKTGAVCVAGLCQNYAANGVDCSGDDMCYSEHCGSTGGCAPRLPCE